MTSWQFLAGDESMTDQLAAAVAQCAPSGTVIGLTGTLGAGKTRFVRGLAVALGVPADSVASPTFVLCHEYDGTLPIYHYDAYRLRHADDLLAIGAEEVLGHTGIALVEWADRVTAALPSDRLDLRFEDAGGTVRRITITACGPQSRQLSDCVRRTVGPMSAVS